MTVTPAFPDPGSPEGQRWAAAGFPVRDGAPEIPPAPPAVPLEEGSLPKPGQLAGFPVHDAYATPARNRVQLILITGHEDDGAGGTRLRGLALGYAEDTASFTPAQLTIL
jgi:hypothetical protein